MRARSLLLSAFAGLSLLSLAVVSSVTPASAKNPPQAAGPEGRLGAGGFGQGGLGGGGGFGGGQGGGFGQGAIQVAAEPPVMSIDGDFVYVLRRGVLYKVEKKSLKLVGEIPLGPAGGFGRPGGGGFGGGGGLGGGRPGGPPGQP